MLPGLLLLVPPSIDMRGNISGALVSRLASSMHLGEFEIKLAEESVLGDNIRAAIIITLVISLLLGLMASGTAGLMGIHGLTPLDFTLISVFSGILSGSLLILFTLVISAASYWYGLDLDMIGAPSVTAIGDLVTVPILLITALGVLRIPMEIRVACGIAILILAILLVAYTSRTTDRIRSIFRESLMLLPLLAFLGIIAGAVYSTEAEQLTTSAALLILIPPFMGVCGSIGGIMSSRLATGLHMGTISPTYLPGRDSLPYFSLTFLYAVVLLPFLGFTVHIAAGVFGMGSPGALLLVGISMSAGVAVMALTSAIAYLVASLSFLHDLDPDSFGIPIITTTIDVIGALVLTTMIAIVLG